MEDKLTGIILGVTLALIQLLHTAWIYTIHIKTKAFIDNAKKGR